MTYTISGKQYTEFDINKRCADILGLKVSKEQYMHYGDRDENVVLIGRARDSYGVNYCSIWSDASAIIDKCWDELNKVNVSYDSTGRMITSTKWNSIMIAHECTKLTAACICLIWLDE
jgi:hypothetical protein